MANFVRPHRCCPTSRRVVVVMMMRFVVNFGPSNCIAIFIYRNRFNVVTQTNRARLGRAGGAHHALMKRISGLALRDIVWRLHAYNKLCWRATDIDKFLFIPGFIHNIIGGHAVARPTDRLGTGKLIFVAYSQWQRGASVASVANACHTHGGAVR